MSSGRPGRDASALTLAEQAHGLVQADPRRALALAERALAASVAAGDAEAEVASRHALGWAQYVLGDAHSGRATLTIGIRLARRSSNRRGEGLLRRHLAFWLALDGETRAAQREIAAAISLLPGIDRARSQVQRIEVHRKSNNADAELHRRVSGDAARALRLVRQVGDELWEARLLNARGLLHLDRGELDAAETDLAGARDIFDRLGARAAALDMTVVIAEIALLRGEVLAALEMLDEVEPALTAGRAHEYNLENLEECRMRALVAVRMLPEARAAAEALLELCARTRRRDWVPSIALDLAAIAMMAGDAVAGARLASRAERLFVARGRSANAALARAMLLRARLQQGGLQRASVRSALEAAAVLGTARWRGDELRTRLVAARVALAVGDGATAAEQLTLAQTLGTHGTVTDRIELHHARALQALSRGEPAAAERLLRRGLQLLDDYRGALGAIELRATASGIGAELAQQGLRIALASGRPAMILAWAEQLRGNALRLPSVRPPRDPKLRRLQTELRRVATEARAAEEAGRQVRGLARRRGELESAIRARARLLRGEAGTRTAGPDLRKEAAEALGERALVEYVEVDGMLLALTLSRRRLALHELGPVEATAELEWLRFALGRLARGSQRVAERAATLGNAAAAAAALDHLLLEPLLGALEDRPLVVVPTGPLHALPWGRLPSLRERPVVVAPSLATWLDLARRPRSRARRTALVGGPRLRNATTEVRGIARLHPDATVLTGRRAKARAVLEALDGARLAHLACHGSFRTDSPLLSSLELADGPLNVYEFQRIRRAPEVVVLSACDLAQSHLHPGDELIGLATALLAMGTRSIVASVVPVSDAGAPRLMLDLHRRLAAGAGLAAALAAAQTGSPESGFVCLGTG